MGYGTNATVLPALCGKGDLIVSDKLNHSSIVNGCRASGAHVRSFAHNDPMQLDQILRESIALGQPRTRLRWKKVLVVVEGIYSMEGEICRLKEIAEVAKKYKAYVYLDEAHSIGALGKTGRGVTEYHGVDTKDVTICMGTFTKSFGGMGGYIAADKSIIQHLRRHCAGMIYHNAMSPVIAAQVLRALRIIRGEVCGDLGKRKLTALTENANFFRKSLIDMGLHLYGDWDSPIIPVLIYMPMKLGLFSRQCLKRGLAVVVVCFPATPLETGRVRFCISAAHTKEDMREALAKINEVADIARIKYSKQTFP
uniref:serine C-palmitoyltransferase n=1 Tax=Pinguiococcus pyrenoidosus TaxID=172671 RepID=A0A7R9U0T7_9STRA